MTIDVQVNRFDELIKAVRSCSKKSRWQKSALWTAGEIVNYTVERFKNNSAVKVPAGIIPDTIYPGMSRPRKPINESWITGTSTLPDGADLTLANESPYIQHQRFGTTKKKYIIPFGVNPDRLQRGEYGRFTSKKVVTFHIGPPLKWPISIRGYKASKQFGAHKKYGTQGGMVTLQFVRHPGFGPWGGSDFVARGLSGTHRRVREAMYTDTIFVHMIPVSLFFGVATYAPVDF